uniref:Putative site-specific recombinase, XerC/D-like n=1 Tax=uncultured Flavobacteriia bacterium TaxID=212695 RepID=H6RF64_9BACT|nr:integrase [uncultured bacterium]CCF99675.1 putative site-specific recombinase, XerC/D-like [uncultured Flavobacteriia bacterium]
MDNIAAFLRYLSSEKNYSTHTIRAYSKDIEGFAIHCSDAYGLRNLEKVHFTMLRDYIISLSKRGLTMRSINRNCSALKSLYTYFQKTGIIEVHPFAKHKAVKAKKAFITPFSVAELNTVLEQIDRTDFASLRDATAIELLYGTGIRQSELIELKTSDIDWAQSQMRVLGKRNKERLIPMIPALTVTLNHYLEQRNAYLGTSSNSFLLVTNKGNKTYPAFVYRLIKTYFRRVSSKISTSPHVLRHSFATHMLDAGADINVVQEILGHESLAATQEYTKVQLPKVQDAYRAAHPRAKK